MYSLPCSPYACVPPSGTRTRHEHGHVIASHGAQEARVHATGAETQCMATDGIREVRAHVTGAETWGTAVDGARDGAETRGAQRGGTWARVRGVDVGEMRVMEMCAPRGPGCAWRMHKGRRQQWRRPVVRGPGAEAVSRIITASILQFKEHTTYCLRLLTATGA